MIDQSNSWQSRCGIQKIIQHDAYGCGVACLAMVSGTDYNQARTLFVELGLGQKRSGRQPFSTNSSEMRMAVASAGLLLKPKRWSGWAGFNGLAIIKVRDDWRGAHGKWHWVVAFRHPEFEIAIFDPHMDWPAFKRMPLDTFCTPFRLYEPKGEWLQVEQRISLVTGHAN